MFTYLAKRKQFSRETIDNEYRKQFVVPKDMISVALKSLHNDSGNQGRDRVTLLIRERFYWININSDINGPRIAIDVYVERFQQTSEHLFDQYRILPPRDSVCGLSYT